MGSKSDLQPTDGADPNHVAVDETVIQLNSEQYWLYAAVNPDTNRLLHVRLYPTRTNAISSMFLSELREKHQVDDAIFLVDRAPWLQNFETKAHDFTRGMKPTTRNQSLGVSSLLSITFR